MKLRYLTVAALSMLMATGSLFAYKTKWKDKKQNEHEFSVSGVIHSGYEFNDYQTHGEPDSTGPTKQNTGFRVSRAYVNLKGKGLDGNMKGWGFRITTDIAPAADQGDGCATSPCGEDNDYNVNLKYAHVIMPTPISGLKLILGQQHVPGVDGKAGVSLQKFWGHRYVEKTATEYLGMSSSTDRGLALAYKSDYFGLHMMIANGEGYHHNNGEGVATGITSLSTMAKGSSDSSKSYGYDLYAMPSIVPTGKNENFKVAISFPVRLQNIYGIDAEKEMRTTQMDISSDLFAPTFTQYIGDAKSKRDYSYGVEIDMEIKTGDLKLGLGVGSIIKVDKRTNAYKIDQSFDPATNLNSTSADKFGDYIYLDQDQKGLANYIQASIKYRYIGIFGRYTIATSNSSLKTRMGTASTKGWGQQMLETDATDGTLGNLGYLEATNTYDAGKAKTRSYTLGFEIFVNSAFTVATGITEYWGDNPGGGKHFKKNPLNRVSNAAGTSLDKQLESNNQAKGAVTGNLGGSFESDDFVGERDRQKQVYIKTSFKY